MPKTTIQIGVGVRRDGKMGVNVCFAKNWKLAFSHNLSAEETRWMARTMLEFLQMRSKNKSKKQKV